MVPSKIDSPIWGMTTSVGMFSFPGRDSWNGRLRQTAYYIGCAAAGRFPGRPGGWGSCRYDRAGELTDFVEAHGHMKHTILGAGAIGGLLGTALASLGNEVSVIVRREKLGRYPETFTLERPSGTLNAKVTIISELSGPTDVLWIATKTYQFDDALKSIMAVPPAAVPLLNGIEHIAVLRSRY